MKKVVVKIALHDDKGKQKAMKAVASLTGIDSILVDMKEQKIIVTGSSDPVDVVTRLRKYSRADIVSVGPAEEEKKEEKKEEPKKEEKKEEPKKEEAEEKKEKPKEEKEEEKKEEPKKEEEVKKEEKKEEEKKEEPKKEEKKEEPKKEEEEKKEEMPKEVINEHLVAAELARAYRAYNPQMTTYYYVQSAEENPNSCAII